MSKPKIRIAASTDAEAIRAIYVPYIATSVTFEETVPTPESFQARTDKVLTTYPYLAAELDGKIIGIRIENFPDHNHLASYCGIAPRDADLVPEGQHPSALWA